MTPDQTAPSPTTALRSARTTRVRSIQYLRAVAALAVVAYHASGRVSEDLPQRLGDLLYLGHGGVDLFFVISGFIMWSIGCEMAPGPRSAGRFLIRRAIRVVPPYWVATLGWVGVMTALGVGWIVITPDHILKSMLFIPHWSPTFPDTFMPILVPGWTLIFEMYFYLLFALALLAPPGRRLPVLAAILVGVMGLGLVVQPGSPPLLAYTSPLLLEFLAGCLIAEAWRRRVLDHLGAWFGRGLIVAGLVVLVLLAPLAHPDQTSWGRPLTFGLAGALIVWGAVSLEERMADLPWLERLGDASYAIYLFHLFLLQPFARLWQALPLTHGTLTSIAFILLTMLASSLMGLVIFRVLEQPMQRGLTGLLLRRS